MALPTDTTAPTGMPRERLDPMTSSAIAPDCEIRATLPPRGMSRKNVLAHGLARSSRSMSPAQLGPAMVRPCVCASSRSARSRACPSSPPSAKPPGSTSRLRCPLAAASRTTSRIKSGRTTTTASSHAGETADNDGTTGRPSSSPPLGLTGTMRPRYPDLSRLRSTAPPELVGRSPAPTTATLAGRRNAEREPRVGDMRALAVESKPGCARIVPAAGRGPVPASGSAVALRARRAAHRQRQQRAEHPQSADIRSPPPARRPRSRPAASPRWPWSP